MSPDVRLVDSRLYRHKRGYVGKVLWPASDKLKDHKIFSSGNRQDSPIDQDRFSTVYDTPFNGSAPRLMSTPTPDPSWTIGKMRCSRANATGFDDLGERPTLTSTSRISW